MRTFNANDRSQWAEYRVTFNGGSVRHAKVVDAYSLVAFLGGAQRTLDTVYKIEIRNVVTGEWVETGILEHMKFNSPSATWVD